MLKELSPTIKSIEREVNSIADFSGAPKASVGSVAIKKVLDAETDSKDASAPVAKALKNIEKVACEEKVT